MSIVEKFVTMDYGPAPEDPREALAWLDHHKRRFGHFIDGEWQSARSKQSSSIPPTLPPVKSLSEVAQGSAADIDAAVKAARSALSRLAIAHATFARTLFVCTGAPSAKTFAPVGRARNARQWQTYPRIPRHRYSASRPPFLSPRWLGPAPHSRISWLRSLRRSRPNHSLEFSAAHVGVENRARSRDWQHGRIKTRGIHPAHCPSLRRNLPGN